MTLWMCEDWLARRCQLTPASEEECRERLFRTTTEEEFEILKEIVASPVPVEVPVEAPVGTPSIWRSRPSCTRATRALQQAAVPNATAATPEAAVSPRPEEEQHLPGPEELEEEEPPKKSHFKKKK